MLQQRAFRVLGAARHSESATPLGKAPHVELANASWYMITDLILTMLPQILEIQTLGPAGLHWGQIPAFEASYDSNIWGLLWQEFRPRIVHSSLALGFLRQDCIQNQNTLSSEPLKHAYLNCLMGYHSVIG